MTKFQAVCLHEINTLIDEKIKKKQNYTGLANIHSYILKASIIKNHPINHNTKTNIRLPYKD